MATIKSINKLVIIPVDRINENIEIYSELEHISNVIRGKENDPCIKDELVGIMEVETDTDTHSVVGILPFANIGDNVEFLLDHVNLDDK